MSNVSIIIPVHALAGERLDNFIVILDRICSDDGFFEVIVVEQVADEADAMTDLPADVRHILNMVAGTKINKPALLNLGAQSATGDVLWFNDADVYLPFGRVLAQYADEPAVKPYQECLLLTGAQTGAFCQSQTLTINMDKLPAHKRLSVLGGGALIIRRSLYVALRGYNESMPGWGPYDREFGERLRYFVDVDTWKHYALHFWHPFDVRKRRAQNEANGITWQKCKKEMHADYAAYLAAMPSSLPITQAPFWKRERLTDTAVIIAVYGDDPARIASTTIALTKMFEQRPRPDYVVVELLFSPNTASQYPFLDAEPNVTHVLIQGTDLNRDLFQKEALYNIGATHTTADYLIFCDNDCFCEQPMWFSRIRRKLIKHPDLLVQGFRYMEDTIDTRFAGHSFAANVARGVVSGQKPGLCWGMTRATYTGMDGFNPLFLAGAGDAGLMWEIGAPYPARGRAYAWYQARRRLNVPAHDIDFVRVDVKHENHGAYSDRAYVLRYDAVDALSHVEPAVLDENGLLAWTDVNHPLRAALKRKPELSDSAGLKKVLAEITGGIPLLTYGEFTAMVESDPDYYTGRWEYLSAVIRYLYAIAPSEMLEIGPYRLPLAQGPGVTLMDRRPFDYPNFFQWDAMQTPWPQMGTFDVVVALQVWEEFQGQQQAAFEQVKQITNRAVMSFPYLWTAGEADHLGIDDALIASWVPGATEVARTLCGRAGKQRLVCWYEW